MDRRSFLLSALAARVLRAQNADPTPAAPQDWVCPMDADYRSDKPGVCPRCGMKLILGVPPEREYRLDVDMQPPALRVGEKTELTFCVRDPDTKQVVKDFTIMHEKLFHMFIVSQDMTYFVHDHPQPQPDGSFHYVETFPKPGMYRILGDFYPTAGTPQLIARTAIVPAPGNVPPALAYAKLAADVSPKQGINLQASLTTDPPQPLAGFKTLVFFELNPAQGLQKYIGAWAHMLAASDDLVDMIHSHPFIADGGPKMQFNLIFPRARTYRIWVQMQREGVVNTFAFNVPVKELS